MQSLLRYLGAKHSLARHYGPPRRETVVEPFAGGAGYSVFWEPAKAILIEKNPRIYGIWHYLINETDEDEIRALPIVNALDDLPVGTPSPLIDLIGFWFSRGAAEPWLKRPQCNSNPNKFWGEGVRERLAEALTIIRNWEIIFGDWSEAPIGDYHYHVDPPYQQMAAGRQYMNGAADIDYQALGKWCTERDCIDVCEGEGANWLNFDVLKTNKNQGHNSYKELVWRQDTKPSLFDED